MDEKIGGEDKSRIPHIVAHESAVHGALLMDLLRMARELDPDLFQRQVERAERELREVSGDPERPTHGGPHSVLEHRLAFLRSVQIQANVR